MINDCIINDIKYIIFNEGERGVRENTYTHMRERNMKHQTQSLKKKVRKKFVSLRIKKEFDG